MYNKPFSVVLCLFVGLFLSFQTKAQTPSFIAIQDPAACDAQTITVHVTVENLPAVVAISHMLVWDPTVLRIDTANIGSSLTNLNTNLDPDITTNLFSAVTDSTLGFNWIQFDPSMVQSFRDNDTLYSIVFDLIGDIGSGTLLREFPDSERSTIPELVRPRNIVRKASTDASEEVTNYPGVNITLMSDGTGTDNTPPVVNCIFNNTDTFLISVPNGATSYQLPAQLPWTPPTATDNCGTPTAITNFDGNDVFDVGTTYAFTYQFIDGNANTSETCSLNFIADTSADNGGNNILTFRVLQNEVDCGDTTVTVRIVADNFVNIRNVTHMLTWDTTILSSVNSSFAKTSFLPPSGLASTNTPEFTDAALSYTLSAPMNQPVTITNGDTLYTIIFNINPSTDTSSVLLREFPSDERPPSLTGFNTVRDGSNQFLDYNPVGETINLASQNDNTPPVITNCPDTVSVDVDFGGFFVVPESFVPDFPIVMDDCGIKDTLSTFSVLSGDVSGDTLRVGLYAFSYSFRDFNDNVSENCTVFFEVRGAAPGDDDLVLKASDELVECNGDTVRVDLTLQNFQDITSISHILVWDSTKLSYAGQENINPKLFVGIAPPAFNSTTDSTLSFTWSVADTLAVDFDDDEILYTLLFAVNQTIQSASPVSIRQLPNSFRPSPNLLSPFNTVRLMGGTLLPYDPFISGSVGNADNTPPEFLSFPDDIRDTIRTEGTCSLATGWIRPNVSDNCTPTNEIIVVSSSPNNSSFNAGETVVTYTITDEAGNSRDSSFTVTIIEIQPPVFNTCPSDVISINPTGGAGETTGVNFMTPQATDICSIMDLSGNFAPNAQFPYGTTPVIYTATDSSGNTATCEFNVIVVPFRLECPNVSGITFPIGEGVCEAFISGIDPIITVNDSSLIASVNIYLSGATTDTILAAGFQTASGSFFNVGVTTVTYEVVDIFGFSTDCSFNVTAVDNIPPVLGCADILAFTSDPSTTVDLSGITLTDNCSDTIFNYRYILTGDTDDSDFSDLSNVSFNLGITNVFYRVDDGLGNADTCNFTVEVRPQLVDITCQGDIAVDLPREECETIVNNIGIVDADTDTSIIDTMSYIIMRNGVIVADSMVTGGMIVDASGLTLGLGTNTVTYSVIDTSGIEQICVFDVEVQDLTQPDLLCFDPITIIVSPDEPSSIVNDITPNVSDDCSLPVSLRYELTGATMRSDTGSASGQMFNSGITTVTYIATDASGNERRCSFPVEITGSTVEFTICPNSTQTNALTDTCGFFLGTGVNPTISNPEAVQSLTYTLSGATEGSGVGFAAGAFVNVGRTTIEYTLISTLNDTIICSFDRLIRDRTDPVLDCPGPLIQRFIPAMDTIGEVNGIGVVAVEEACDFSISYNLTGATFGTGIDDASGSTFKVGFTTVTYTATDASGRTGTCDFTVELIQSELNITCPESDTLSTAIDACGTIVNDIEVSVSDEGAVQSTRYEVRGATIADLTDTVGIVDASGLFLNAGVNNITYFVTDTLSGEPISCSFDITVVDSIAPVLTCLTDTLMIFTADTFAVVNNIAPSIQNNCADTLDISYLLSGATIDTGTVDASGTNFLLGVTDVTYTVTDTSGNSSTCTFPVKVQFQTIELDCLSDTIIRSVVQDCSTTIDEINIEVLNGGELIDSVQYTFTGELSLLLASDSIFAFEGNNDVLFPIGTTNVVIQVFDNNGLQATCDFDVIIRDTIPPVIECPGDITAFITMDEDSTLITAPLIPRSTSDNCSDGNNSNLQVSYILSGATMGNDNGIPSGVFFQEGITNVQYVLTDPSGNTDTCAFMVNVMRSNIAFDCPDSVPVNSLLDSCGATVFNIGLEITMGEESIDSFSYTITGATDGITVTDTAMVDASGTFFNVGESTVTYTIFDNLGTGTPMSCTFIVTVEDTIKPEILCPNDVVENVATGITSAVVNNLTPNVDDDCGNANLAIRYTTTGATILDGDGDISGSTFNLDTTIVTYYVEDEAGNEDSCSFNVIVREAIILLECPDDITAFADANDCDASIRFRVNSSTSEALITRVVYTTTFPDGTMGTATATRLNPITRNFGLGVTNVKVEAFDGSGNSDMCSFNITVLDTIAPSISCPEDILVRISQADSIAMITDLPAPSIADNCSPNVVSHRYLNTDGIEVQDSGMLASGTFGLDTTSITYFVTDNSGKIDSCSFNVVVEKATIELDCPDTLVIAYTTLDSCGVTVSGISAGVTAGFELIDSVSYELSGATEEILPADSLLIIDSYFFNVGITNVKVTVFDSLRNSTSCMFDVEVRDTISPTIFCPENLIATINAGDSTTLVGDISPLDATGDNCTNTLDLIITYEITHDSLTTPITGTGDASVERFMEGVSTVTYTVEDEYGNLNSCSFTVTVTPGLVAFECPDNVEIEAAADSCTATVFGLSLNILNGADDIDSVRYTLTGATEGITAMDTAVVDASGNVFNIGETVVTYTVFDATGELDCSFTVMVRDTILPMIVCPEDVDRAIPTGTASVVINTGLEPTFSDNCGMESLTHRTTGEMEIDGIGDLNGTNFPVGTTMVTYYATDVSGNVDSCSFEVVVREADVVLNCPDDVIAYTEIDNCNASVRVNVTASFGNDLIKATTYTLTAPDSSTRVLTPPRLISSNRTFPLGLNNVNVEVRDSIDNVLAVCNYNILVLDTIPPSLICPDDIAETIAIGDSTFLTGDLSPTMLEDACGVASLIHIKTGALEITADGPVMNFAFPIGTTTVTYIAKDSSNNESTCSFDVAIDRTSITLDCPDSTSFTAYATVDTCGSIVSGIDVGVMSGGELIDSVIYDLSGATIDMLSADSLINFNSYFFNLGTTTVSVTAFDAVGSSDNCTFTIEVRDTILPEITCPPNAVGILSAGDSMTVVANVIPNISDNCTDEGSLILTYTITHDSLDIPFIGTGDVSAVEFLEGVSTVTYIVDDGNGNTNSCFFTVTVTPGLVAFECPDDVTIDAAAIGCGAIVDSIGLTITAGAENIDSIRYTLTGATDGIIVTDTLVDASGNFFNVGETIVTYTIFDSTGMSQCMFTVTVRDTIAPTIVCPADIDRAIETGMTAATINSGLIPDFDDDCSPVALSYRTTGETELEGDGDLNGASFNVGTTVVTYYVTDGFNVDSCSFNVVVREADIALNCPDDLTVYTTTESCEVSASINVTALFGEGRIGRVEYTLTDEDGEVRSATSPQGLASPTRPFPLGINTVNVKVFDTSEALSEMCNYTITVLDTLAPMLACPPDIMETIALEDSTFTVADLSPTMLDDACGVEALTYSTTGALDTTGIGGLMNIDFPIGTTTVTYTATDSTGNESTCAVDVVISRASIVLDCPDPIIAYSTADSCSVIVNGIGVSVISGEELIDSVSYDISGATTDAIQSDSLLDFDSYLFNLGITTVSVTAFDDAGNTNNCSFTVEVIDTIAPEIICQADITFNINPDSSTTTIPQLMPTQMGDNCTNTVDLLFIYEVFNNDTLTQIGIGVENLDTLQFGRGTTTLRYIIEDEAGLRDTCEFDVNVEEGSGIMLNCPTDITAFLEVNRCAATVPNANVSAAFGGELVDSVNYVLLGANNNETTQPDFLVFDNRSFNAGQTLVTVTAYEGAIPTVCQFTVTVIDTIAPSISCPADVTETVASGETSAMVENLTPNFEDNCDDLEFLMNTISYSINGGAEIAGDASGTEFMLGTSSVTYYVADSLGNRDSCTFSVTVEELTFGIICPDSLIVNTQVDTCGAIVNDIAFQTSDVGSIMLSQYNLSGATEASAVSTEGMVAVDASGLFFNLGSTDVTYTAADTTSGFSTCTFEVVVIDTIAPTFACPTDVTISVGAEDTVGVAENIALIDVFDNCDTNPAISYILSGATVDTGLVDASGISFNLDTTIVTYYVEDASGNIDSCSFIVNVEVAPIGIECPNDITISAAADSCANVVNNIAVVLDSSIVATITYDFDGATTLDSIGMGDASGSTFNKGITTVTYTVMDTLGNTEMCSFDVTIIDDTAPVIVCPDNQFINIATEDSTAIVNNIGLVSIADNCDDMPSISYSITGATTITDSIGEASGTLFNRGVSMVTYTVMDADSNMTTCAFEVQLGEFAVEVECPTDTTVNRLVGECGRTVSSIDPILDTLDGITSISYVLSGATIFESRTDTISLASGTLFNEDTTTVNYTIITTTNDTLLCAFNVVVLDTIPMMFVDCPEDLSISAMADSCIAIADWMIPSLTDSCGAIITSTHQPGDTLLMGATTVMYFAENAQGETDTCSFVVTVTDSIPPVFASCPVDTVLQLAMDTCGINYEWTAPIATDNCMLDTVFNNFNPGDFFTPDTTVVVYTAVDMAGNTATCSFNVIVQDTVPPMLVNCPSDTIIASNPTNCGRVVVWTPPTVIDNCEVTLTSNLQPGTPLPVGITTVFYTAIDAGGNEATCSFNIEIQDLTPPIISCPDTVRVSTQSDDCDVIATWEDVTARDNCTSVGEIIFTSTHMSGDTFPAGITIVTYIATDLSGNADTCSFPVIVGTIVDTENMCPDDIVLPAFNGTCERTASWTPPAQEVSCSEFIVTSNFEPGDTFPVGTTEVIYVIENKRGDTTMCSFNVTIIDDQIPGFVNFPSDTIISVEAGDCEAVYNWIAPTAIDNCGIERVDSTHTSGSAFPLGETLVQYMAVDSAGNIGLREFTIRVIDNTPPVLSCADTVVIRVDGMVMSDPSGIININPISNGCNSVILSFDAPSAMDGCSDTVEVVQIDNTGLRSGSAFPIGTTTLIYAAMDNSGNAGNCNFVISILPLNTIDIQLSNDQPCEGDSITVVASNVGITDARYVWTGAFRAEGRIVTVAANDLRDNQIFVEVNAGDGCALTGNASVSLQTNPQPFIITNNMNCAGEGGDLLLSAEDAAGNDIVTWIWSYPGIADSVVNNQNQIIENITAENSGFYQVTAISAAGCEASVVDTIIVAAPPATPALNLVPLRDSVCVGSEFTLIGTTDPTAGIQYNFAATPDTGLILMPSDSNIATVSFQEQGSYVFSYWVSNGGCNSDTATVALFVGDTPTTDISFTGSTECVSADSTIQLFELGGDATSWTWLRPDSTVFSTEQNPMLMAGDVQNGTYTVIASIGTCEAIDTINLEISGSILTPTIAPLDFDACTTDTLMLSIMEQYDSTVQFIWTSSDPNLIATPIMTDTGYLELRPMDTMDMTMVMVQAINGGCVSAVDTITFRTLQGPAIDLSTIITEYTCIAGDSIIQLVDVAGEGNKYEWTGPCDFEGGGVDNPTFIVNFDNAECRSGRYSVTILGDNGCEASDFVDLNFETSLPKLQIAGASTYCEGEDIVLSVNSSLPDSTTLLWKGPEGLSIENDSIIRITAETFLSGGYTVTAVGDSLGCSSLPSDTFFVNVLTIPSLRNDEFTVIVDEAMDLDVLANDSLIQGVDIAFGIKSSPFKGNVELDTTSLISYLSNEGVIGRDNFTYEVCYTGCQDKDQNLCEEAVVNINIVFPPELCVVADFVTPNGDGKNDNLIISCAQAGEYPNNELILFNQWGDEVFRASPYENDWNGTYNGDDLPDGTYFYIFTPAPNIEAQKGFITLFR